MSTATFSRPEQLSDAETILYEIDMFRFAAKELVDGELEPGKSEWVRLECFLLHFRNLIEFLGKKEQKVQATDLHVSNLWQRLGVSAPPQLAKIWADSETL